MVLRRKFFSELCIAEQDFFFLSSWSSLRNIKGFENSQQRTRILVLLNKGHETRRSLRKIWNNQARVPVMICRRKHLYPHVKVTMLMRMKVARNCLQKKKQKLHQRLKERQVHLRKFHQIRQWYCEKALFRSVRRVIRPH